MLKKKNKNDKIITPKKREKRGYFALKEKRDSRWTLIII